MSYKLIETNFTVLFLVDEKKPVNKLGKPASSINNVQFFKNGYKVKGLSQEDIVADLEKHGLVELSVFKAEVPDDFDPISHKAVTFWDFNLDEQIIYKGVQAVERTPEEQQAAQEGKDLIAREQQAGDFLRNIDLENMTQNQANNAISALIIIGGYQR